MGKMHRYLPLRKVESCHLRLQLCDVIQVDPIRTQVMASFVYEYTAFIRLIEMLGWKG